MTVFLLLLILSEVLLPNLTCASRVHRQTTKVRISATGDTIMLKFLQPHMDTKLEGYILGYGSSLFSKQFIQLPVDGEPYETEIDAEPKYLVAVQPIQREQVKKPCTGKETLEKPLHLLIGSVTQNSVKLSWGTLLNSLSSETNLDDCIKDGQYTVRYREKDPEEKWNYQTCPTTDTIIDQLKPDTPYEFGVRAEADNINGAWSPPVTQNTAEKDIDIHKPVTPDNFVRPKKPITESPQVFSASVPVLHRVTESRPSSLLRHTAPPPTQRVTPAKDIDNHKPWKPKNILRRKKPTTKPLQVFSPSVPDIRKPLKPEISLRPEKPITEGPQAFSPSVPVLHSVAQSRLAPILRHPAPPPTQRVTQDIHKPLKPENFMSPKKPITESPQAFSPSVPILQGVTQSRPASLLRHTAPPPVPRVSLGTESDGIRTSRPSEDSLFLIQTLTSTHTPMSQDMSSPSAPVTRTSAPTVTKRVPTLSVPNPKRLPPTDLNASNKSTKEFDNEKHKGLSLDKLYKKPPKKSGKLETKSNKIKMQSNQVDKDEDKDKVIDPKLVDTLPILKPSPAPPTTEIYQTPTPTTTPFFASNGSWYNMGDNSSVFSPFPVSEVDSTGKKRFVAPHVIYQIDKSPEQPCSVTHSLSFFPDEENGVTNITGPPKTPPTNLTVVTVEGCPSFVIIDWEKTDNETKEYEVTSSVISPNGHAVSVVTTNQTHTAVENLKPESSYEFTVTPKNELGSGPSSEPVSFSTESADPRVSEIPSGKNAIWSSFSFKADSYSECTGTQYVKRTWYRKFVGIQLCNSLRYKIYLSDSLKGKFYDIGDEAGYGEDHCQFVDSYLDGRTGGPIPAYQLPLKQGYFRSMRQEPVKFGKIGGNTHINYVAWYECGVPIPGSW
ncbi:target of Nesh-SH3 isoform X3 [Neoarius graeffei]|uniref:target of Nesh-SH3 isoform X3 n=1 Tax=Neoarius graeffei TaxID=443677 RepID=UPI00298D06AA|nr:target of Nesh-SH3 isoform X3 [Neoarius graeffei]